MKNPLLEHLANALEHHSESGKYYAIVMNGKQVSFHGKRVFATKGAARNALNRGVKNTLRNCETVAHYAKNVDPTFVNSAKELMNSTIPTGYNKHPSKELIKDIVDDLLKEGFVKIEEV